MIDYVNFLIIFYKYSILKRSARIMLLRLNSEGFSCKLEGKRRKGYERTYSVTVSRRYTHRAACCESNALLWLWNMGQRPERTL